VSDNAKDFSKQPFAVVSYLSLEEMFHGFASGALSLLIVLKQYVVAVEPSVMQKIFFMTAKRGIGVTGGVSASR
jgi:hypothetical protein